MRCRRPGTDKRGWEILAGGSDADESGLIIGRVVEFFQALTWDWGRSI